MIVVKGGSLTDDSFTKLQTYMNSIQGENGQHAFLVLETENAENRTDFADTKQPEIEIKDLAAILQKDELFQEYLNNGRKKIQSSFLLPDLYVGYTTDFNRATAQSAMEVTEKQVFQPERISLAWVINNKLLNGYGFKFVEAYFEEPDITNPDDIFKILNVTERAGGLPPNAAKELTFKTLGKDAEDYPEEWGNIPLQYLKSLPQQPVTPDLVTQVDAQIQKAANKKEDEVLAVMKEVRKLLVNMSEGGK
jgi:capsid portal protein